MLDLASDVSVGRSSVYLKNTFYEMVHSSGFYCGFREKYSDVTPSRTMSGNLWSPNLLKLDTSFLINAKSSQIIQDPYF